MRVIRHIFLALIFTVGAVCNAQTPTPHPNALQNGTYYFPDMTSPDIELVGNWFIASSNGRVGLSNWENHKTLEFHYTEETKFIEILSSAGNADADIEICLESVCSSSQYQTKLPTVFFNKTDGNGKFTYRKRDGRPIYLYFMRLIGDDPQSVTSGTTSEATPAYIYPSSISGTNTEFHYLITAGDVSIINALTFLFLSFWAVVLIFLVFKPHVR